MHGKILLTTNLYLRFEINKEDVGHTMIYNMYENIIYSLHLKVFDSMSKIIVYTADTEIIPKLYLQECLEQYIIRNHFSFQLSKFKFNFTFSEKQI